jgi:hypothetical protein
MRWSRGWPPRVAAICSVPITLSLFPQVAEAAAQAQASSAAIAYGCRFPSGIQQVEVRVTATLPNSGAAGQTIQPGEPTVTVTVPQQGVADVIALGAATVAGRARLTVHVVQPVTAADSSWQDLAAARTAVSPDGDLTLTATGMAPEVRLAASGEAVLAAGPLDLQLTARRADGTATDPAVLSLACTPVIGYDTTIGAVAISGAGVGPGPRQPGRTGQAGQGRRPAQARQTAVRAAADGGSCPPPVTGGLNPKFPLPTPPPGTSEVTSDPQQVCALTDGFSNVNKLHGAATLGGPTSVALGARTLFAFPDPNYLQIDTVSVTHFRPSRSTFLDFGFMPVSATMQLTQLGTMNIAAVGPLVQPPRLPTVSTASGEVALRLSGATVNGVPLDLGPNCRAKRPIELVLHGSTEADPPYLVDAGGQLTGNITIPPFIGCGVGEDLDPLLTATLSGPDNFVRVLQGPVCDPLNPQNEGKPCPPVTYGFTVKPGGEWNATATGPVTMVDPFTRPDAETVTCQSVIMNGTLKGGSALSGAGVGRVTGFRADGCTGTGPLAGPFTVTAQGLPWILDADFYDAATGTTTGHLEGEALRFAARGCGFDAADPAATAALTQSTFQFGYANSTHTLTATSDPVSSHPAFLTIANVSGCDTGFELPILEFDQLLFDASMRIGPPQTLTAP